MARFDFSGRPDPLPSVGDFSWLNQGLSTIESSSNGHLMLVDGDGSAEVRGRMQTFDGLTTTWSITMHLEQYMTSGGHICGIVLRDSSTSELVVWMYSYSDNGFARQNWTNPSTYSAESTYTEFGANNLPPDIWLRVDYDGTNHSFQYSLTEGETWIELLNESATNFLTNPADQYGYGGDCSNGTDYYFRVNSFEVETTSIVDPSSVAGLSIWLDASDTSTITTSGDDVTEWRDKSGNGNDVSQTAGPQAPHSGTRTLNSLNVLDFSSISNQHLENSTQVLSGNTGQVFVVWVDDTTTGGYLIAQGDVATNYQFCAMYSYGYNGTFSREASWSFDNNSVGGYDWVYTDVANHSTGDTNLSAIGCTGSAWEFRYNGLGYSSGVYLGSNSGNWWADNTGIDNFTVGILHYNGGLSSPFDGAIAEILIYDDVTLTGGEIGAIESYLADKWNVTLG